MNKQIIDVTKCIHFDKSDIPNGCTCYWDGECNHYCYYKQLKRKEQECEELHSRTASIIYCLTGGRLSYSTYTLEGCEDAYRDQLEIGVKKATKELEEENETLKQELSELFNCLKQANGKRYAYKQALDEIEEYCKKCNLKADFTACDILEIINKVKDDK